jgi:colanic acid biosynthesis glycosyl transferase WcaI
VRRKKILIHAIAFSPDGVSTAYLYNDIATGLRDRGYDVVVFSTTPHYNVVQSEIEKQPLQKCWGGLYYRSNYKGICVYHVPQKKFKRAMFRVAGFLYWHFLSCLLCFSQRGVSLILSPSPPLTIGFVSIVMARLKGAKVVYNVQEIYPDFLINQGNLGPGIIQKTLRWLEHFVYNHSDKVVTIDQVFYDTIITRFKDPQKLKVIPNFVDTEIYKPLMPGEVALDPLSFPQTSSLKVMYAGNIGHAQDWPPLFETALAVRDFPIEFFVIGEGIMKASIQDEIQKSGLTNISLLPYQARDKMPGIIAYADIHFIFMNPQMEGQGFPSKVYTIMACKKPLLITSGRSTPLYRFLEDQDCAFLVAENKLEKKVEKIKDALLQLLANRQLGPLMGKKGYDTIVRDYSKHSVITQYTALCKELIPEQ